MRTRFERPALLAFALMALSMLATGGLAVLRPESAATRIDLADAQPDAPSSVALEDQEATASAGPSPSRSVIAVEPAVQVAIPFVPDSTNATTAPDPELDWEDSPHPPEIVAQLRTLTEGSDNVRRAEAETILEAGHHSLQSEAVRTLAELDRHAGREELLRLCDVDRNVAIQDNAQLQAMVGRSVEELARMPGVLSDGDLLELANSTGELIRRSATRALRERGIERDAT